MNTTSPTAPGLGDKPVTSVMSRPVVAVRDSDTLDHVLRALTVTGLRHLAVVDAAGGCVGLISDRTVCAAWVRHPMLFDHLTIAQIIDEAAPTVGEHDTVRRAAQIMHGCGTDAVVIVDEAGTPVGVLTTADLVNLLAAPATA
jgi:predicted transcriptional regulator